MKIEQAIEQGVFSPVAGQPCHDNAKGDRAFVDGEAEIDCCDPRLTGGEIVVDS